MEVQKQTYVDADEETARALTYDIFRALFDKIDEFKRCHDEHIRGCNIRFLTIENRRKKDTALSSVSGFVGGFVAVGVNYLRKIF